MTYPVNTCKRSSRFHPARWPLAWRSQWGLESWRYRGRTRSRQTAFLGAASSWPRRRAAFRTQTAKSPWRDLPLPIKPQCLSPPSRSPRPSAPVNAGRRGDLSTRNARRHPTHRRDFGPVLSNCKTGRQPTIPCGEATQIGPSPGLGRGGPRRAKTSSAPGAVQGWTSLAGRPWPPSSRPPRRPSAVAGAARSRGGHKMCLRRGAGPTRAPWPWPSYAPLA